MSHALAVRKLTVAAINGGAQDRLVQALCCDVRFAAVDAKVATHHPARLAAGVRRWLFAARRRRRPRS